MRSTGTEDAAVAEEIARQIEAARKGRVATTRVAAIFKAVGVAAVKGEWPISAIWELYLKQPGVNEAKPRTLASRQGAVKQWVEWMGKRHAEVQSLDEVTEGVALEYFAELEREGWAAVTRNNHLSSVRSTVQRVRVAAGLDRNVFDVVPRAAVVVVRKQAFTLDQVRALFAAAAAYEGRVGGFWPAAVALGYWTGMRLGDVCCLEASAIDRERGLIRFVPSKTSQRKQRELAFPLVPEVEQHLPAAAEGPLWPAVALAHLRKSSWLSAEWNDLVEAIDLKPTRAPAEGERRRRAVKVYGFHSLRHTFVTLALEAGVEIGAVQQAAGHGSVAMTDHYSHSQVAGRQVTELLPSLVEPVSRAKGETAEGNDRSSRRAAKGAKN